MSYTAPGEPFLRQLQRTATEACRNPEQPPTTATNFRLSCPACVIAMKAAIAAPAPEGEFNGWYEQRDVLIEQAREQGVEL